MKTEILKRLVNNIGHNKKLLLNQTWNENIDLKKTTIFTTQNGRVDLIFEIYR